MLIAKDDRKVFIATGQGLEGVLPDAFLSQVIRSAILPQFKQGQYAQGINDGLNQIIAASKGEFDAAQVEEDAFDKYIPFLMVLAFIAIVLFGEFQYHKDEVYISPNQRDQLNKIIRQSTISRRRGGGSVSVADLAVASAEAVLPVVALVAVASVAVEQVEVGKTKSFTQILSYARIAPYSDLFEQGTLWKR